MTSTIVSIEEAATRLNVPVDGLEAWLRQRGLVRTIAGQDRVSLKVLEAQFEDELHSDHDRLISTREAAKLLGISRATLERLVDRAPPGLPGGPTDIGSGQRRHLRWDPTTLTTWAAAVRAAPQKRKPRRQRVSPPVVDEQAVRWADVANET